MWAYYPDVRGVENKDFPEMTAFEKYSVDKADMPNQHWLVIASPAYCDEIKILGGVYLVQRCSKRYQLMQLACVRRINGSGRQLLDHGMTRPSCSALLLPRLCSTHSKRLSKIMSM